MNSERCASCFTESSRLGGCHYFALKATNVQHFSPNHSLHTQTRFGATRRIFVSRCGAWTLVGLIWAFHIAVPATRVKELLNWAFQSVWNYVVLDAKTAWWPQPMEASLLFHGAVFWHGHFDGSVSVHSFKAFQPTVVSSFPSFLFLYERPHISVTTTKSTLRFDPIQ